MIEKMISQYRSNLFKNCKMRWNETINQWKNPAYNNNFWLNGAANYLFRTENVLWAVDFSIKNNELYENISPMLLDSLDKLNFVLVTHAHKDHFNPRTLEAISSLPIKWIIPEFMLDIAKTLLSADKIITIGKGESILVDGIKINAFEGLHSQKNSDIRIDSMGYMVEAGGKKLLFTSDVRDYKIGHVPKYEDIDVLFMHIWLGRKNALNQYPATYIDQLTNFALSHSAKKIVLSHLYEIDRPPYDMWRYSHAGMVMDSIIAKSINTDVVIPRIFDANLL